MGLPRFLAEKRRDFIFPFPFWALLRVAWSVELSCSFSCPHQTVTAPGGQGQFQFETLPRLQSEAIRHLSGHKNNLSPSKLIVVSHPNHGQLSYLLSALKQIPASKAETTTMHLSRGLGRFLLFLSLLTPLASAGDLSGNNLARRTEAVLEPPVKEGPPAPAPAPSKKSAPGTKDAPVDGQDGKGPMIPHDGPPAGGGAGVSPKWGSQGG